MTVSPDPNSEQTSRRVNETSGPALHVVPLQPPLAGRHRRGVGVGMQGRPRTKRAAPGGPRTPRDRYLSGGPVIYSIAHTPAPVAPTDSDPHMDEALRRVRSGSSR